jgi:hypothetical protein
LFEVKQLFSVSFTVYSSLGGRGVRGIIGRGSFRGEVGEIWE